MDKKIRQIVQKVFSVEVGNLFGGPMVEVW